MPVIARVTLVQTNNNNNINLKQDNTRVLGVGKHEYTRIFTPDITRYSVRV